MIQTQTINTHTLGELARWSEGPCVSMYLPLDPKHPNIDADRLALKDLVADARRQLETTTALRRPSIDELLAPAEALIVAERWPLDHRGYALLAAPGRFDQVYLDVDVPALSVVADRFVVTPLLAAVERDDRFFVLAISQNRVRFFRGGRERLVDVPVPDLPASRADALWYEHHERLLNVHGGTYHGVDQITGAIHGAPSERDLRKQQLLRFFRIVDEALTTVLHDETAPLLVAGVDYELAIYREASHHPNLAAVVDTGSPERLRPAQLHTLVWPVAAELVDAPRRQLLDRLAATADPLTSIPAILAACREGRIAALLAEPTHLVWGRLEAADGHGSPSPGDVELVSVAIGAALDQGATVGAAAPGELPRGAALAALARY